MVTGGSKFDARIGADLHDMGFNILQAYGATETSGAATLMRSGDPHLETVGHPLPGVEIRIGAPEAGEETTDGEVLIRGAIVMQGYHNRPDATAAAVDADGWLHSGDLGRATRGPVVITGRRKELIVLSSGKNIYPEEIEAVYRRSPFVKEICVLGLARPGEPRRSGCMPSWSPTRNCCRSARSRTSVICCASRWKAHPCPAAPQARARI